MPGPPLPDPDAVRLCPIPDSAPPYDDELSARAVRAAAAAAPVTAASHADPAGQRDQPGGPHQGSGPAHGGGPRQPGDADQSPGAAAPPPGGPGAPADGAWPGQFAQVLVETLAGSRPPRQISTWATDRARARIQRLGPMLAAGQRPQLRRVVAFRPASGVIEMTVVVSFGPRVRALALRLEHSPPHRSLPGHQARGARWLCTEVEAA